ncbi:unnamed protein product [Phytophthora fragariaefolia]|uniref:Unnamed protein product n=1 Tax=Phytophthora fragariaefolia TaxID=1490495 RepID=A0A9W7CUS7_9STRA|nr:unnamed protein product [Phytophthora fragariaefolia]
MELASSVMRFALATYFMKRGGGVSLPPTVYESSWDSASYELSIAQGSDEEDRESVDAGFSDLVAAHVANLRQLLVGQRFRDWSSGVAELREYAAENELLGSLVAVLVKMIRKKAEDAVCIVQGSREREREEQIGGK